MLVECRAEAKYVFAPSFCIIGMALTRCKDVLRYKGRLHALMPRADGPRENTLVAAVLAPLPCMRQWWPRRLGMANGCWQLKTMGVSVSFAGERKHSTVGGTPDRLMREADVCESEEKVGVCETEM